MPLDGAAMEMKQGQMRAKILLVDDETANLKLLRAILDDSYDLIYAKNGQDAITLTIQQQPDLILLDIMMPEMDGFTVCRRVKENPETREIPVMFVTAKREVEDETQGFEMGAVDYLTKPVSPPVVKARVKTQLSLRQAFQDLSRQNAALLEAETLRRDVDRITRHDLKSPLNGVIGFAAMHMEAENLTDMQREHLRMIHDLGYRVVNMVNLSLGLFKMEQGSYELDARAVDLLPMVRGIVEGNQRLIRVRKSSVSLEIDGRAVADADRFLILGEELLCYSMFSNLIKNALEATPEGQPVRIAFSIGADGLAETAIHNHGAVPEAVRSRFFDKYATAGKKSGTGLGTYSARLIAETQRGSIGMTSSEEVGTTVTVRLPMG